MKKTLPYHQVEQVETWGVNYSVLHHYLDRIITHPGLEQCLRTMNKDAPFISIQQFDASDCN